MVVRKLMMQNPRPDGGRVVGIVTDRGNAIMCGSDVAERAMGPSVTRRAGIWRCS